MTSATSPSGSMDPVVSGSGSTPPAPPTGAGTASSSPDPDPNSVLISKLKSSLPPELSTWVDQYGPSFLVMSEDELKAWVLLAVSGNSYAAYEQIAQAMPEAQLISEWDRTALVWTTLNTQNAQRITEAKAAVNDVVGVLLKIAIAALATA